MPRDATTAPTGQIPHWLFAFDAAGIAVFQTLHLLATHPAQARRAAADPDHLRPCVLEALRLWPTTPAILRDSTVDTAWGCAVLEAVPEAIPEAVPEADRAERGDVTIPAGTAFVIFTPFLHRDPGTVPHADRFTPRFWLDAGPDLGGFDPASTAGMLPFSAGAP